MPITDSYSYVLYTIFEFNYQFDWWEADLVGLLFIKPIMKKIKKPTVIIIIIIIIFPKKPSQLKNVIFFVVGYGSEEGGGPRSLESEWAGNQTWLSIIVLKPPMPKNVIFQKKPTSFREYVYVRKVIIHASISSHDFSLCPQSVSLGEQEIYCLQMSENIQQKLQTDKETKKFLEEGKEISN